MNFIRHYLIALQFFTRIPVTGRLAAWVGYSPDLLRASAAHFPGVGWLVGLLAALGFVVLRIFLPDVLGASWVAAVVSTGLSVLLTGAFHEDGLSDVADGLGGAQERDAALAIMKDSRVGAFGVLALVLALLLKVALLVMLDSLDANLEMVCAGLLGAHVTSRAWPLLLIRLLPHVGDAARSKSKPLADQISTLSLLVAGAWLLGALVLLQWALDDVFWLWPLLASGLAFVGMWRLFAYRLQGFTGDCLGATQQACELAFYFGLVLAIA
jgi:adenosylcobinamide-GDP ribazoletransferase